MRPGTSSRLIVVAALAGLISLAPTRPHAHSPGGPGPSPHAGRAAARPVAVVPGRFVSAGRAWNGRAFGAAGLQKPGTPGAYTLGSDPSRPIGRDGSRPGPAGRYGSHGYGLGFGGGIGLAYGTEAWAPTPSSETDGRFFAPRPLPALAGIRRSPVEPPAIYVVGGVRRTGRPGGSPRSGSASAVSGEGGPSGPLLIRIERGRGR